MNIHQISFHTKQGLEVFLVKVKNDHELEEIKEILGILEEAGDIMSPAIEPVTPEGALTIDRWQYQIERQFGAIRKGRPDVSRVNERMDPETEKMVRNLLVSAFEGGSNYWYRIESQKLPPGTKKSDFSDGGRMQPRRSDGSQDYFHWSQLIPTFPGGHLVIREIGEGEGETFVLDLAGLKKGLMIMKKEYPKNYKRVLDENDDADDGDLFLQLALFGKHIYG